MPKKTPLQLNRGARTGASESARALVSEAPKNAFVTETAEPLQFGVKEIGSEVPINALPRGSKTVYFPYGD